MMKVLEQYKQAANMLCQSFRHSECQANISPLVDDDITTLKQIGTDPSIWRFARFPKSEQVVFNRYFESLLKDPSSFLFTIRDNPTQEVIGFTRLKSIDFNLKRAETGTWLMGDFQGKGLNKYIKKQLLTVAFEILKLEEVYCYVNRENQPSVKSLLSLGFVINEDKNRLSPTHKKEVDMAQYYIHITAERFAKTLC
ncbi:GNAT family N-acetyltransferase [Shewanella mesophila]|uniref:GNAT family N-acetyltransferase n=1 Tax=Shewanella mesophila TaxID=2864208 RepID=UPI001C657201|nr:GNAT family N-acetyltransferase [Shewanella mesophila]QYJ85629.1 GNAT family N-acetyltransferase [Shewanella mesophila]